MNEITTQPATRRDLATKGIEALDPAKAGAINVSTIAGGVSFATAMEVMEFAKLMCISGSAVPPHLRNNPGACLALTFRAVGWRMDPFAVAEKSYEVNDRIGFESQLIHAVIEARAPLQHRLDCRYDGEGLERTCTVIGNFTDGQTREYTSPPLAKVKKKSPLWVDDPDQQLFYYASRSWARKWCPDVLLGVYSREELAENPRLGRDDEPPVASGLHTRLAGAPATGEGHREGFAASELDQLATNGGQIIDAETTNADKARALADAKAKETAVNPSRKKKTDDNPDTGAAEPPALPKTPAEYVAYATAWIQATPSAVERTKRFKAEMKMRNEFGVTADDRAPLDDLLASMSAAEFDKAGA